MSFFGKNIRKIRSIQKMSQAEFAELFDLSRARVGSYEEGRAEPKIELINRIANHFSITLDVLINKELTVNELYHFDVGNEPTFKTPPRERMIIKTVPLISSAHLSGIAHLAIEDDQEEIQLPMCVANGKLMAIVVQPNDFKALPANVQQNDTLIIDVENAGVKDDRYYLIKTDDAIYISKLRKLANDKILITQEKSQILIVDVNDIHYYYPIVRFLGHLPEETESENVKRLEQQLTLLIEKIYQ